MMTKYGFFFLLVVLVVGCQAQAAEMTGTPTATIPPLRGEPIPVELSALAANPTVYENAYIRLTGQYTLQPRLVCESDPHPSPVTWGLSSDTLLALAGGLDEQLRPLLPQGLTMTVAGRWRHWLGDVGCGTAVQPQDLWYLQVTEIISPSPLTMATLTPVGAPIGETPTAEGTTIAEVDPTQPVGEGTAVIPTPLPGGEATETSPIPPETGPTALPTTAVPGDPSLTVVPTPTSSLPGTVTPGGTESATTTPDGSGTPLPGTTPTAGPSPTSGGPTTGTPVPQDMGQADTETLLMDRLDSGELHSWTFDNELANNKLMIQVVPAAHSNVAITVFDPNGAQIANQNSAGNGTIETVTNLNLPSVGAYEIILSHSNNVAGDYAMMILDDFSFFISLHQIDYGAPQNTSFTVDEEQIWLFDGSAGDRITITADPTSGTPDIGFDLIGPLATDLEYVDLLFESGDPEVLSNYTLTETGLYGIWLFGDATGTMNVQLSVSN